MRHRPWLLLGILVVALAWLASEEIQHSYYQSRFVSDYASQLAHELLDGPSERINGVRVIKFRFPRTSGRLLLST